MTSRLNVIVFLFAALAVGDARRVVSRSKNALSTQSQDNTQTLISSNESKVSIDSHGNGSEVSAESQKTGENCCCVNPRYSHGRGNPAELHGWCPLGMCMGPFWAPWDIVNCPDKQKWTCFKTPGLGCLFKGNKPPAGYQLRADPVSVYSSLQRKYDEEFTCPGGCDRCCTDKNNVGTKFLCMTDLKPPDDWRDKFAGGRDCDKKASWKKDSQVGWARACKYEQREKDIEPWNHKIHLIAASEHTDSLDVEPCRLGYMSEWEKKDDYNPTGRQYEMIRLTALQSIVDLMVTVSSNPSKCPKEAKKALASVLKVSPAGADIAYLHVQDAVVKAASSEAVYMQFGGDGKEDAQRNAEGSLRELVGKDNSQIYSDAEFMGLVNSVHLQTWCTSAHESSSAHLAEVQRIAQQKQEAAQAAKVQRTQDATRAKAGGTSYMMTVPKPSFSWSGPTTEATGVYVETPSTVNGKPIWMLDNGGEKFYIWKGKGTHPDRYKNTKSGDDYWWWGDQDDADGGFQDDGLGNNMCSECPTPPNEGWRRWNDFMKMSYGKTGGWSEGTNKITLVPVAAGGASRAAMKSADWELEVS